jgi:hypothetical protein
MLVTRTEKAIFKSVLGSAISQYRNKQIIYSQGKTAGTKVSSRRACLWLWP